MHLRLLSGFTGHEIVFFKTFIYLFSVPLCAHMQVRRTFWSQFPASTLWVPRLELTPSDLRVSTFTHGAILRLQLTSF